MGKKSIDDLEPIDIFDDEVAPIKYTKHEQCIVIKSDSTEAKVYFRPNLKTPNIFEMRDALATLECMGFCIGSELDRYHMGEVKIFFNPIYQDQSCRKTAIELLVSVVKNNPLWEE